MQQPARAVSRLIDGAKDDRQFVTALARGLEVLRCFSAQKPELGTSEIAAALGLPQPTVWRLCHTLTTLGYLVPGSGTGKLRVGTPVISLGAAAIHALAFTQLVKPHMERLASRFPAAFVLAEKHMGDMIYLLRCDGKTEFVLNLPVGSRLRLGSGAVSWTCVAAMSEDERRDALEQIREHCADWERIFRHIESAQEMISQRGFVTSVDDSTPGVSFVVAPVASPDPSRQFVVLGGGPSFVLSRHTLEKEIGPELLALADHVASAIPLP